MRRKRIEMIIGEGSGFFISADGYAVTNNHVVDHAKSVQVTTDDGTIYTAKVVGTDPKTDLALIKVDGKSDFPYVKFADHEPRVGDWVIAVGNPFGLGGTVTAGIVSARGRDIGSGPYDDFIQIDAPINKGNSGGPTFDMNGNVIGVNTAIFSPSGGSVGIGFDIPARDRQDGRRPAEGARLRDARLDRRADPAGHRRHRRQPRHEEGRRRASSTSRSPAARPPRPALQPGDVITAVNGTSVKDARDLARKIATMAPGSSVKLDVLRKGESTTVSVTLGQHAAAAAGQCQRSCSSSRPTACRISVCGWRPRRDVEGAGETAWW